MRQPRYSHILLLDVANKAAQIRGQLGGKPEKIDKKCEITHGESASTHGLAGQQQHDADAKGDRRRLDRTQRLVEDAEADGVTTALAAKLLEMLDDGCGGVGNLDGLHGAEKLAEKAYGRADDVAQAFMQAMTHWSTSVGESFHVVSPQALSLRGYAENMAAWFGQPASLSYLPWEEWRTTVSPEEAQATWDHIAHSPNCSIAKAQRLISYQPRYSSLQGVREAVTWLIEHEIVRLKRHQIHGAIPIGK